MNDVLDVSINSIHLNFSVMKKDLLKNLHFKVGRNTIFGLMGENGKGKTTLLKSLCNLLDKSTYTIDGKIIFNGINILSCDSETLEFILHNEIKFILQDAADCFDPLKKIGYYFINDKIDRNYFDQLLDYFLLPGINKIINIYPHELSIGMAQRLAIIWGLLFKPELLLLDEPNSALDLSISNLLSSKLREVASEHNQSIIFVTQDADFAVNTASKIGLITDTGLVIIPREDFLEWKKSIHVNKPGKFRIG